MKIAWIAGLVLAAAASAHAQSTIYKHIDDSGRVTYSNKPMKGATVLELEPMTVMQSPPAAAPSAKPAAATIEKSEHPVRVEAKPAVATLTPVPQTLAAVEPSVQRRRDNER